MTTAHLNTLTHEQLLILIQQHLELPTSSTPHRLTGGAPLGMVRGVDPNDPTSTSNP
jgi:hypothetical protein